MTFIKWEEKNKLGHTEIDNQHESIHTSINTLYEIQNEKKEIIVKEFELLINKFVEHFETEDQFMKKHNVPSLFSHTLEHERALGKYTSYLEEYKINKDPFDVEIVQSLKTWIHNHAEMKDSKFRKYL
ncbi:MAG: hemerythrin family protein [Melioribacteraceae bacterium]